MLAAIVFIVIVVERLLIKLEDHHFQNYIRQLSLSLGPSLRQVIRQVMEVKMRANAHKCLEQACLTCCAHMA